MSFRQAVLASPPVIGNAFRPGKQALSSHSTKVACADERRITGSIDLDTALQQQLKHAQAPRWDYGLGYRQPNGSREFAIWVEVHSAFTGEVRAMRALAEAGVNVTAVDAVAAGAGRFGAILWVKPEDVKKTAKLLRAKGK